MHNSTIRHGGRFLQNTKRLAFLWVLVEAVERGLRRGGRVGFSRAAPRRRQRRSPTSFGSLRLRRRRFQNRQSVALVLLCFHLSFLSEHFFASVCLRFHGMFDFLLQMSPFALQISPHFNEVHRALFELLFLFGIELNIRIVVDLAVARVVHILWFTGFAEAAAGFFLATLGVVQVVNFFFLFGIRSDQRSQFFGIRSLE